jgi:hypothetical protein
VTEFKLIDKPGQYDIPMSIYHTQCCVGPSVSSSGLRKIRLESPADFWATSDLNDNRWENEANDAFTFGRAAHALILGDEDFNAGFAVVPKDAPRKPTVTQINARAEGRVSDAAKKSFDFWDQFDADNAHKEYLKEDDLDAIGHISRKLNADPVVQTLLDGQAEQSLIWQDQETGIFLKSRLDMLSGTGDLADLKSTHHKDRNLLYRSIRMHGYDMQLGLATMALEHVLGIPFEPEIYEAKACILLFVYKSMPYHVMPIEVNFDALYWARIKCRAAINLMKKCIDENHWPGPIEGIATYTADYEMETLAQQQRDGILPPFA